MDVFIVLLVVIIASLGLGTGFLVGRFVLPMRPPVDPIAVAGLQAELARLQQEAMNLRSRAAETENDRSAAVDERRRTGEDNARLTERAASLSHQLNEQLTQITFVEAQRDSAIADARRLEAEVARLEERESALTEKVAEQASQLRDLQKQLTTEFENIANRILKTTSTELSDSSQKSIAAILEPLRERIHDFQKQITSTYDAEKRDVLSLKEEIRIVVARSDDIGTKADNLTKALRGDSKVIGRWGEVTLENVLQRAGLVEGREYITQGRGLGLKSKDGSVQRPDVIVRLPEKRAIIIDAKVSLSSYEKLVTAEDELERAEFQAQLVRDMKAHIDSLYSKQYQDNEKLIAHEHVIMFVPIEGALAAALNADPALFVYGWDRRVVLSGPPTLLINMSTVASLWRYERQGENAQEIARLAGELCDKLNHSMTELQNVEIKIENALSTYRESIKRLATGKNNALAIGDRIRGLGVRTKRPTPPVQVEGIPIQIDSDDFERADESSSAPGNVELG